MNLEWIKYCNVCNAAVSDGVLTVVDETGMVVDLDACAECAGRLIKESK